MQNLPGVHLDLSHAWIRIHLRTKRDEIRGPWRLVIDCSFPLANCRKRHARNIRSVCFFQYSGRETRRDLFTCSQRFHKAELLLETWATYYRSVLPLQYVNNVSQKFQQQCEQCYGRNEECHNGWKFSKLLNFND